MRRPWRVAGLHLQGATIIKHLQYLHNSHPCTRDTRQPAPAKDPSSPHAITPSHGQPINTHRHTPDSVRGPPGLLVDLPPPPVLVEVQHQLHQRLGVPLERVELRPAAVHRAAVAPRPPVRREHDAPADAVSRRPRTRTTRAPRRRAVPRDPARGGLPHRRAERLPHRHRALRLRRQAGRGGAAGGGAAAPWRGRPARRGLVRRRVVRAGVPARELVVPGVRFAVLDPAVGALAQDLPVRPGAGAERPVQGVEPVCGEEAAGHRGAGGPRAAAEDACGLGAAVGDVEVAAAGAACVGRGLKGVAGRRVLCGWAVGGRGVEDGWRFREGACWG